MQYLLTIRVPFEAMDDVDARGIATKYLKDHPVEAVSDTKLQRLVPSSHPVGVPLTAQEAVVKAPVKIEVIPGPGF
jgi:hypothetical protein